VLNVRLDVLPCYRDVIGPVQPMFKGPLLFRPVDLPQAIDAGVERTRRLDVSGVEEKLAERGGFGALTERQGMRAVLVKPSAYVARKQCGSDSREPERASEPDLHFCTLAAPAVPAKAVFGEVRQ
jgi:hypothetical protein